MFQDCIEALFLAVERSRLEDCFEHFLRARGMLDDSAFRSKVSAENRDTSICSDRLVSRTDDVLACHGCSIALVELLKPLLTALIKSVLS